MGAFRRVLRDESGQSLAEYALIAAMVAVAALLALSRLGGAIRDKLDYIKDQITNAQPQ